MQLSPELFPIGCVVRAFQAKNRVSSVEVTRAIPLFYVHSRVKPAWFPWFPAGEKEESTDRFLLGSDAWYAVYTKPGNMPW